MVGVRAAQARVCERNVGTLRAIYPVGAIYISTTNTNPADLFGFGTWQRFGNGRTLVGVDEAVTANISGETFGRLNEVQLTGGRNTHTMTTSQMPSHDHTQAAHSHYIPRLLNGNNNGMSDGVTTFRQQGQHWLDEQTPAIYNTGGGQAHNNLQPYITVFMWRRSA